MEYGKSFYDHFMHPLEANGLADARNNLIPKAKGHVLEIGPGSGINLRYYTFDQIDSLSLFDQHIQPTIASFRFPKLCPLSKQLALSNRFPTKMILLIPSSPVWFFAPYQTYKKGLKKFNAY